MISAGLVWTASTSAAGIAAIAWGSIAPRSNLWGRVITRGALGNQAVALTFDDGPTPGATDRVLDVLADLRIQAAFFVIGANVVRSPKLIQRIHEAGHIIGNHSFTHSNVGFFRGGRYWRRQVGQTNAAIEAEIGRKPALFRPPMGIKTWLIDRAARHDGHAIVTWSKRAFDGIHTTADRIVKRLAQRTRPGEILLLHDGVKPGRHRDVSATIDALPRLISAIRQRGLQFARLDELIGLQPYQGG